MVEKFLKDVEHHGQVSIKSSSDTLKHYALPEGIGEVGQILGIKNIDGVDKLDFIDNSPELTINGQNAGSDDDFELKGTAGEIDIINNEDGSISFSLYTEIDGNITTTVNSHNSVTSSGNTFEVGATIENLTLNWSYNKSPTTQSIDNGIGVLDNDIEEHTLTAQSITSSTTYTLTYSDSENTNTDNTSVNFTHKMYIGNTQDAISTESDLGDLLRQIDGGDVVTTLEGDSYTFFNSNNNITLNNYDAGSNAFIYVAYPTSFGTASFKVNGLNNTAWTRYDIDFINRTKNSEGGSPTTYYVYVSNSPQNGTRDIEIS